MKDHVGVVGTGIYLPKNIMTAKEISKATGGIWSEDAVKGKLGINKKCIPSNNFNDGTQEMGVYAAIDCLKNTGINPLDIDLILCVGEEYKEYPLTTSGIYIQEKIGARKAWAIDLAQRCCTTVSAMKIAKDMMMSDSEINTVMIVGGYRNGDFVDYKDKSMSMMYNLAAGGGAIILKKNYGRNEVLDSCIMSDGSMARDAAVEIGGIVNPINHENLEESRKSLRLLDSDHMKNKLNEVSLKNWFDCIDKVLQKGNLQRKDIGYLAVLHFKRSMHKFMLKELGLDEEKTIYLEDYGHIGQIDQILSIHLGLKENKITENTIIMMIAAGIGYAWSAGAIRWGVIEEGENDRI
ncbi:3-oxoacyl-ACP synthase [Oceanirhabdus seepicola]|uniref:3-oxoacyl-ACP synthase n=1 Tax=Oceanirhabdus seepicola TaxID=2828781 RepID=A0A9J6P6N5_9CLOT|nr:3-oxoacyl-ACP synthase [Oceanirhabdus seepicola]MCM1992407.1 3-oxoacyl-ACP synthase [Oceanirhabdus seepicola]